MKPIFKHLIALLFLVACNSISAQSGLSGLAGTVKYELGRRDYIPVNEFQIILMGRDSVSIACTSSEYRIMHLEAGTYTVTCVSEYGTQTIQGIILSIDKLTFVDIVFVNPDNKKRRQKR